MIDMKRTKGVGGVLQQYRTYLTYLKIQYLHKVRYLPLTLQDICAPPNALGSYSYGWLVCAGILGHGRSSRGATYSQWSLDNTSHDANPSCFASISAILLVR